MAVQPVSLTKFATIRYNFGSDHLREQPELGALVANVIAGWSATEAYLGMVFGSLIGASEPTTMNMYAAFRSFDTQRTLLETAARDLLSQRYADILEVTLTVLGRAARIRHQFAHGIWGASPDIPDALLLAEPKGFWAYGIMAIKYQRSFPLQLRGRVIDDNRIEKSFVSVYNKSCLEGYAKLIDECFSLSTHLQSMTSSKTKRRKSNVPIAM